MTFFGIKQIICQIEAKNYPATSISYSIKLYSSIELKEALRYVTLRYLSKVIYRNPQSGCIPLIFWASPLFRWTNLTVLNGVETKTSFIGLWFFHDFKSFNWMLICLFWGIINQELKVFPSHCCTVISVFRMPLHVK